MNADWLLDRICDDPVVVIDTARTPAGDWATVVITRDEALSQIEPLSSPTWPAAQEAHARMIRMVCDNLAARGIPQAVAPSADKESSRAPEGSRFTPAIDRARALGIDIAAIEAQLRRSPAERIRVMEEQRRGLERLRPSSRDESR